MRKSEGVITQSGLSDLLPGLGRSHLSPPASAEAGLAHGSLIHGRRGCRRRRRERAGGLGVKQSRDQ